MKRKVITLIMAGMMAVSLAGCTNKSEGTNNVDNKVVTSNSNDNDNDTDTDNTKNTDSAGIKVTEEELKEISNKNIERLKAFYDKNGLPYSTDHKYNNSVDEARINLVTANVEARNIDTKGVNQIEYQYVNNFTIQASIATLVTEGEQIDLTNSLAKEYAEAIADEELDFSKAEKNLQEFINNYVAGCKKFEEVVENENYTIRVLATTNEKYTIALYSKFEVK